MTSATDIRKVGEEYSRRFGNLDTVGHISLLYLPEFGDLMQKALDRNTPLTRSEVEEVFGDPGWEL